MVTVFMAGVVRWFGPLATDYAGSGRQRAASARRDSTSSVQFELPLEPAHVEVTSEDAGPGDNRFCLSTSTRPCCLSCSPAFVGAG